MSLLSHPHGLFIVIFLSFGLLTVLVNYFTVRRFDQYPPAERYPFVSVLVPARNEARSIEICISSLLAQDYPDFEVIVLNDHSTDDTARILARLAQSDNRLRLLKGVSLPEDWLGKHWACHQLSQAAKGELILFTDADTHSTPDMLRASVSALLAEQADLLTAFPRRGGHPRRTPAGAGDWLGHLYLHPHPPGAKTALAGPFHHHRPVHALPAGRL